MAKVNDVQTANQSTNYSFEIQPAFGIFGRNFIILDSKGEEKSIFHPYYRARNYNYLHDKNGYQATSRKISNLYGFFIGAAVSIQPHLTSAAHNEVVNEEKLGYHVWDQNGATLGFIGGQLITGNPASPLAIYNPDGKVVATANCRPTDNVISFKDNNKTIIEATRHEGRVWKVNILSNKIDPRIAYLLGAALSDL